MPSEAVMDRTTDLTGRALDSLKGRIDAFHAAVAAAEREVAAEVLRRTGEEDVKGEQALIELGPFAVGRIDPDRFAQLLGVAEAPLTSEAVDVLSRANSILTGFRAEPERHVVDVEPGGDLRDAVKAALADFGRAYGAARAVELARAGTFDEVAHGHLLGPLPFRLWHRAERQLAPPLIVRVRGEDCLPVGLGEFLDGNLVLVLIAGGPTTPAPLSRLITPGTFVMQTADPESLSRLAETEHPGVAILFDEDRPGQAHFVHDPDAGEATWGRLTVDRMPSEAEVGRGRRVPMWVEEVEHLRALAEAPPAPVSTPGTPSVAVPDAVPQERRAAATKVGAAGGSGVAETSPEPTSVDPVDRLAAWLLSQADLDGPAASGAPEE
ncbi:MAG: hypothetical protein HKN72_02795 [Gemmatimonadetes bacterium]|nr:hypothetical protein [Gemmatimonadota bacterium]